MPGILMVGKSSRWDTVWARYGIAVAAVAAVAVLMLLLSRSIWEGSPFLLFFAAIVVSAWLGGRGPGLLATGMAAAVASFFFMVPYNSFSISTAGQAVRLLAFVVEGIFISILVSELHRARRRAEVRAVELQSYHKDLREDEERSRRLADEVVEGLALSENGEIFDANKTFTRMFGYELDELIGMDVVQFVAPEDREQVANSIATDSAEIYEIRGLRKDGAVFPAEIRPRSVFYQGRKIRVTPVIDLTERKRVEEDLRQSEERYRAVVEQAAEGIFLVEPATKRFLEANTEYQRMLGYTAEELTGMTLYDVVAHDRENIDHYFQRSLEEKRRVIGERRHRRRDGSVIDVVASSSLVFYGGRQVICYVVRDITERKRAERVLRRNEALQRAVVDSAFDAIITMVADGTIRSFNQGAERIFGYEAREVMGQDLALLMPERFREMHRLGRRRYLETGEAHVLGRRMIELAGLRKSGEEFPLELTISEVEEDGPLFIGVIRDITERKRAEEELQRSERSLATAQRIAHLGSWEYALDQDAAQWSDELYRIFGFTPQEFVPRYKTFFEHVHPDDRRAVQKEALRALRGRGNSNIDYRIVRSDREVRSIHTEYEVVRDASGRPIKIVGTVQDITDQKRIERELEARAEELEKSNAELERFAYIASHDLQEPLRMVSSYTQLLARRYKGRLDRDADEFIEYAVDGATRMQTLINDLLTYSRVGTQGRELSSTDLSEVFAAARDNLRVAMEESGATITSDQLPTVMGDFTQLVQLFQNLLGNAIKFRGEEPPKISIGVERRGRDWVFGIQDNGIGIDPQYAERVFIIFQRLHTREDYPGTGIGLAVCKRIVERHGGRMWIESETGEGSTFFFTLPAIDGNRR